MKRITQNLLKTFVIWFLSYLIISFIAWDIFSFDNGIEYRVWYLLIVILMWIVVSIIKERT